MLWLVDRRFMRVADLEFEIFGWAGETAMRVRNGLRMVLDTNEPESAARCLKSGSQAGCAVSVYYLQDLREDLGCAGYQIASLHVAFTTGKIANQTTGFRDQQTARGAIPGHQAEFPDML